MGVGCNPVMARRSRGTGFPSGFAFVSWSHSCVCVPVSVCMCVCGGCLGAEWLLLESVLFARLLHFFGFGGGLYLATLVRVSGLPYQHPAGYVRHKENPENPLPYDPPPVSSSLTSLPSSFHPSESLVFVYI